MAWTRCESDWWGVIRDRLPRPLKREEALMDLRYRVYQLGEWPEHEDLAEDWGWRSNAGKPSIKRVRLLKASGDWEDAQQERAGRGQAKGRQRAGEGQANNGPKPKIRSKGAGEGQAKGTPGAARGPRARLDPPEPDTSTDPPNPPQGGEWTNKIRSHLPDKPTLDTVTAEVETQIAQAPTLLRDSTPEQVNEWTEERLAYRLQEWRDHMESALGRDPEAWAAHLIGRKRNRAPALPMITAALRQLRADHQQAQEGP